MGIEKIITELCENGGVYEAIKVARDAKLYQRAANLEQYAEAYGDYDSADAAEAAGLYKLAINHYEKAFWTHGKLYFFDKAMGLANEHGYYKRGKRVSEACYIEFPCRSINSLWALQYFAEWALYFSHKLDDKDAITTYEVCVAATKSEIEEIERLKQNPSFRNNVKLLYKKLARALG